MSTGLTFLAPPPGLAPAVDFLLNDVDGADGLYALTDGAPGGSGHRLYVLDAAVYLPAYQPELSEEQRLSLDLDAPEDAMVLVVANSTETGTTVNLLAPIVLNTRTLQCAQVILEDQDWPVRTPLEAFAAA